MRGFVFNGVLYSSNGIDVCAKFGENGMVVLGSGDLRKNFSVVLRLSFVMRPTGMDCSFQ